MLPEWGIKGCIIEPGGFDSNWRGSSMNILPQHPAYTSPTAPSSGLRALLTSDQPSLGVPDRMAKALFKLADEPKLPLRIQFGSDALALVRATAQRTLTDSEKFAVVSHSTNREGVDGEAFMRDLLASGYLN